MLLALDVGNTNVAIGVYRGETLLDHWRLETKKERTADELGIFLKELFQFSNYSFSEVTGIAISSVVPPLDFAIQQMCARYFRLKPLVLNWQTCGKITINIDHPEELGADRIVNAVAGVERHGGPLIIVDFGTATTFDYISEDNVYEGGLIAPGIAISNEALFERASKLPHIEIKKPKRVIGKNTIESLQSGVFYGYVGLVDSIVERMLAAAVGKKPKVIATGGFTSLIAPESKTIEHVDPFLTLEGLRILYDQYNSCRVQIFKKGDVSFPPLQGEG